MGAGQTSSKNVLCRSGPTKLTRPSTRGHVAGRPRRSSSSSTTTSESRPAPTIEPSRPGRSRSPRATNHHSSMVFIHLRKEGFRWVVNHDDERLLASVGRRIGMSLREQAGLTQAEAAERSTVRRSRTGKGSSTACRTLTLVTMRRIARALNVDMGTLLLAPQTKRAGRRRPPKDVGEARPPYGS